jgi:hypothetical protein
LVVRKNVLSLIHQLITGTNHPTNFTKMTATIKTISIEILAEKLGGNLWVKGDMKRIYLDEGYNTKKMSTKTYVWQKQDGTYGVKCAIDCPGQAANWIDSQEQSIIDSVTERINEIIEEFGEEVENPAIEMQAALDAEEQVQGYKIEWREVRVPINRFGKLDYRKRMFVVAYKGAKSKAPYRFIECNNEQFAAALKAEANETAYEYGNEPKF